MLELSGYMERDLAETFLARMPGDAEFRLVSVEGDVLRTRAIDPLQNNLFDVHRDTGVTDPTLPGTYLRFRQIEERHCGSRSRRPLAHTGLSSARSAARRSSVASIHDRMPAVLEESEARDYLEEEVRLCAEPGSLQVDDAVNPLVKRKEPPVQGELF